MKIDMTTRYADEEQQTVLTNLRSAPSALRPGAVLGMAVASVVGIVGLVQWDLQLMLIGLVAGVAIVVTNLIVIAVRHWHAGNTAPGATYVDAEDMVRLRSPKSR